MAELVGISTESAVKLLKSFEKDRLAIGSYFQKINNKYTLKLSLNMKRREWFAGLWNHSNQVYLPFKFTKA